MNSQTISSQSTSGVGVAATGGGGTGTLLVVLAQNLPDSNHWKSWLVIIAPAVSAIMTAFWVFATSEFNKYRRRKQASKKVAEMRQYLERKIQDPTISQVMKVEYEKQLSTLESKNFEKTLMIIDFQ